MPDFKRVAINFFSGGAGYIVPMLLNILTTPFILSSLGEESYGLQILANVIIGYLIVADMGMDIPITHRVAEYHAHQKAREMGIFLGSTLKIYLLFGVIGAGLLTLFSGSLITILSIPSDLLFEARIVFCLSGFGFACSIINLWGRAIFNGLQQYEVSNGLGIASNLVGTIFGLILLAFGGGVIGFFAARVFGFLLVSVWYISLARKYISEFSFKPLIEKSTWNALKGKIGYGLILRMSGMIFSRMDQTLIAAWIGISVVTVYSFPLLIATTLSGLIASLTHFAFPMVASMISKGLSKDLQFFFVRVTKYISVLATLFFLPLIVVGSNLISLWIGPEISIKSSYIIILLLIAFYVNTCLTVGLNAFVMGMGQIKYFTYYSLSRGFVMLIGFLVLIKIYGINGAGLAYFLALFVDVIYTIRTTRLKLNLSFLMVIRNCYSRPVLFGLLLTCMAWFTRSTIVSWIGIFFFCSIYSLVYVLMCYFFGVIEYNEKAKINSMLKRLVSFI